MQHGHVIELIGKTEVGARVMVNGREVPVISADGTFHYFTPPLPAGESVITITAQNSKGGVNTHAEEGRDPVRERVPNWFPEVQELSFEAESGNIS